jgi:hypothetical protein
VVREESATEAASTVRNSTKFRFESEPIHAQAKHDDVGVPAVGVKVRYQ